MRFLNEALCVATPSINDYLLPTIEQEKTILSTWGGLAPSPEFDFAYS